MLIFGNYLELMLLDHVQTYKMAWKAKGRKNFLAKNTIYIIKVWMVQEFARPLPFNLKICEVFDFQVIDKPPFVCFVQEYAVNGDLLKKIKKNERISEKEGKFLFRQLIEALSVCFYQTYPHKLRQIFARAEILLQKPSSMLQSGISDGFMV